MMVPPSHLPSQRSASESSPGISDLVRQLSDDTRRLATDEIRLAKLEMAHTVRAGSRGAMFLSVAFGAAAVALAALTICVIAALAVAIGRTWIAALITGAVELLVGFLLVHHGTRTLSSLSESVPDAVAAAGGRRPASGVRKNS